MTALLFATVNGDAETVKLLLAKGADVNIKNKDGQTALQIVDDAMKSFQNLAGLLKKKAK